MTKEVILRYNDYHLIVEIDGKSVKDFVFPDMKIFPISKYTTAIIAELLEALGFSVKEYYEN